VNESLSRLRVAAYAVAAVFIILPLIDVYTNALPFDPGNAQWRYGVAGIASNYLISTLFGSLLGVVAGAAFESRLALRVFAIVSLLGAVFLVLMAIALTLDVVQLQNQVRPEAASLFYIGGTKALIKIVTIAGALLLTGIGAFKARKALSK